MVNYVVNTLASPGVSYSKNNSLNLEQEYVIKLYSIKSQFNFTLTSAAPEGVIRAGFVLNHEKVRRDINLVLNESLNKNNSVVCCVGWYAF